MKVVSWNVRDLSDQERKYIVLSMLVGVDLLCLQEEKITSFTLQTTLIVIGHVPTCVSNHIEGKSGSAILIPPHHVGAIIH